MNKNLLWYISLKKKKQVFLLQKQAAGVYGKCGPGRKMNCDHKWCKIKLLDYCIILSDLQQFKDFIYRPHFDI